MQALYSVQFDFYANLLDNAFVANEFRFVLVFVSRLSFPPLTIRYDGTLFIFPDVASQ